MALDRLLAQLITQCLWPSIGELNTRLDRVVDRVKPQFLVHGLVHAERDSRRAGDPEGSRNYTRGGLFYPPHGPARMFYVIFKFSVPEPAHPFRVLTIPAGNHQFKGPLV